MGMKVTPGKYGQIVPKMGRDDELVGTIPSDVIQHAVNGECSAHVLEKNHWGKLVFVHEVLVEEMRCWLIFPDTKLSTPNCSRKAKVIFIQSVAQEGPNDLICVAGDMGLSYQFGAAQAIGKPSKLKQIRYAIIKHPCTVEFCCMGGTRKLMEIFKRHPKDICQSC